VLDGFPNARQANDKISMNQFVAHTRNCAPGNVLIFLANGNGNLLCCLSDDFQRTNNGKTFLVICSKSFVIHAFDKLLSFWMASKISLRESE
jgi:hypothetical protein